MAGALFLQRGTPLLRQRRLDRSILDIGAENLGDQMQQVLVQGNEGATMPDKGKTGPKGKGGTKPPPSKKDKGKGR